MTETKTYCDRCGKEVTYPVTRKLYLSCNCGRDNYDLCDLCHAELCSWFKRKTSEQALAYADQDTLMPAT